jgi:hypothetical protein
MILYFGEVEEADGDKEADGQGFQFFLIGMTKVLARLLKKLQ